MIFSTYKFIFLFLPIVFFGYFLLGKLQQKSLMKIWLIICSFFFYAYGDLRFSPFFLASVVFNYLVGIELGKINSDSKSQKKILLTVGILANVALLGYFKYTDFFISNFNLISGKEVPLKHIVLPIGISFFTFQLIAFLVDSYKGETKDYSIIDYLLFITFFPQLIVGPIIHHGEAVPQFSNADNLKINSKNICIGLLMFSFGCAKKILLADPLTEQAQVFFDSISGLDNIPDILSSWYHSLEYTISYYFDLSGYADMAIGLGFLFNIELPENFDSPYKARNFQDYWRGWHKTLSHFLSDYIFRSWYKKGKKFHGYYAATMATFFVSGFWHGAGWTFVAWGLINGLFVCTASWMKRKGKSFPAFVAFPLTWLGVIACRVLFVSKTFKDSWTVFRGMLNFKSIENFEAVSKLFKSYELVNIGTLLVAIAICWALPNTGVVRRKFASYMETDNKKAYFWIVLAAVLLVWSMMHMNKVASFLYFQF